MLLTQAASRSRQRTVHKKTLVIMAVELNRYRGGSPPQR